MACWACSRLAVHVRTCTAHKHSRLGLIEKARASVTYLRSSSSCAQSSSSIWSQSVREWCAWRGVLSRVTHRDALHKTASKGPARPGRVLLAKQTPRVQHHRRLHGYQVGRHASQTLLCTITIANIVMCTHLLCRDDKYACKAHAHTSCAPSCCFCCCCSRFLFTHN